MRIRKYQPALIRRKIQNLSHLSTLPDIAARVIEMVDNPRTSASALSNIISSDQVLAARILRLANSAYYGFPRQISTINLAIVVLGFHTLRDLVVGICIINQMTSRRTSLLDPSQFWRHALSVGMGARGFAKMANYPVPGEVFVGGLLHDIGILVIMQEFPDYWDEIENYSRNNTCSIHESVKEVIGVRVGDLSAWLAESWNLPEKLAHAIQHVEEPPASSADQLAMLIHFADGFSSLYPETRISDWPAVIDEEVLLADLNNFFHKSASMDDYRNQFLNELQKADEFLQLIRTPGRSKELSVPA